MRRVVLAVVALVLLLPSLAVAQEANTVEILDADVDAYPQVRLLVRAVSEGTFAADDFTVLEGDSPYPVDEATPVDGGEIESVLVIDTSASMAGDPIDGAKSAALSFVEQLPPGAQTAVVSFGGSAEVAQELTDDLDLVTDAIEGLSASGETALYDGVSLGLSLFGDGGAANLVVLTDGADTVSSTTEDEIVDTLSSFEGEFFAVELLSDESDPDTLASLAEAAGGLVADASDPDDLAAIYDGIALAVTSQYVIAYTSAGSGVQQVAVEVSGLGSSEPIPLGFPVTATTAGPTTTTSTVPATVPPGTTTAAPFFFDGPWLAIGLAALFVGFAGVFYFLLSPGERRSTAVRPSFRGRTSRALTGVSRGLVTAAESGDPGRSKGLDRRLDRAGISLRAGEWIVVFFALALLALVAGFLLGGSVIFGLLSALFVLIVAWLLPRLLGDRRQRKFEDQLADMLTMLASTIRTGYAPIQASELVAKESEEPTRTEMARAVAETRLGRDYIDALSGVADRMESQDFRWVVEAMAINRDVGGDVSEILDQVADTIRARTQLRRQVAALSAEGKLSAWILVAVPIFLAWWLWQRDANYLSPLVETTTGIVMLVGAAILMVIGILVIRRIISFED